MARHSRSVGAIVGSALGCSLLLALAGCGGSEAPAPTPERHDITVAELRTMRADGQPLIIVDVQSAEAFAERHIPGSVNVAEDQVETWAQTQSKAARICTACT